MDKLTKRRFLQALLASPAAAALPDYITKSVAKPLVWDGPTEWIPCGHYGPLVRDAYPLLYKTVREAYAAGDGESTFNLPDFSGEFLGSNTDG